MVEDLVGLFWESRAIATKHLQLADTLMIQHNELPLLVENVK